MDKENLSTSRRFREIIPQFGDANLITVSVKIPTLGKYPKFLKDGNCTCYRAGLKCVPYFIDCIDPIVIRRNNAMTCDKLRCVGAILAY